MTTEELKTKLSDYLGIAWRVFAIGTILIAAGLVIYGAFNAVKWIHGDSAALTQAQKETDKAVDSIETAIKDSAEKQKKIKNAVEREVSRNHGNVRETVKKMSTDNVASSISALVAEYRSSQS